MKTEGVLTLEILKEAMKQLPPVTYPKRIRISYGDYARMRASCDLFMICPEQQGGYTLGFCGEWIIPDKDILDNTYEVDW